MAKKHFHKLKRRKIRNGERIYFCVLDCRFRVHVDEVYGKTVICWRCGKPFTMNEYSKRLDKPHCNACTNKKDNEEELSKGVSESAKVSIRDFQDRLRASIEEPIDTTKISDDLL